MGKQRKPQLPKKSPSEGNVALKAETVCRLISEGARLLAAKRPGEAIARLSQAWGLDPTNVATAINLGGAYVMQGKHDKAVPYLEAAVEFEPDNAMAWSNLAAAYLGKLLFATRKRQDRAISAYQEALALDPRAPHVHYNLGLIYVEREDMVQARVHFQGALETDPNDRDARRWLDKLQNDDRVAGPTVDDTLD